MVKVLEEKMVPLIVVKKLLEDKKGEMSYIQQATLDYARKFTKIKCDNLDEIFKKLKDIGLSEEIIIQLLNIAPETIEELRTILVRERKIFKTEELEEILNLLNNIRS